MYCTSSKTNSRSLFLPRTVRFFLNVSLVFLSLYMCGNFSQRNTHSVVEWLHVCLPLYLYAYSKILIEWKYSAECTQKFSNTFFVFRIIRCLVSLSVKSMRSGHWDIGNRAVGEWILLWAQLRKFYSTDVRSIFWIFSVDVLLTSIRTRIKEKIIKFGVKICKYVIQTEHM